MFIISHLELKIRQEVLDWSAYPVMPPHLFYSPGPIRLIVLIVNSFLFKTIGLICMKLKMYMAIIHNIRRYILLISNFFGEMAAIRKKVKVSFLRLCNKFVDFSERTDRCTS